MKAFPKDITVQTMTTRHIGVENELGVPDSRCPDLQREMSKRGLLLSVGFDGGGREFRTNPISVRSLKQVRGQKYLTEYYDQLKKNTKVLDTGGTHIHISILNTDHANLEANAIAIANRFFKQFQKIAGRQSRWARSASELYGFKTLSDIEQYLSSRRINNTRAYNMKGSILNPSRHQTLEFRGPKGSNDCQEVLAWIEFLDNVVKACNRKSIDGVQFKQLLNGERISAYVETLGGWRKLTETQLEQKFKA